MSVFLLTVLGTVAAAAAIAFAQKASSTGWSRGADCPHYVLQDAEPPQGVRGSVRTLVPLTGRSAFRAG